VLYTSEARPPGYIDESMYGSWSRHESTGWYGVGKWHRFGGDVEVTRPLGSVWAMYEIDAKEISASIGTVWNIISDVENERLYWQNLTVSNTRKDGKATEREVTVGL
jgi:pectin methylesterase-like acyl-CoA thioesterase